MQILLLIAQGPQEARILRLSLRNLGPRFITHALDRVCLGWCFLCPLLRGPCGCHGVLQVVGIKKPLPVACQGNREGGREETPGAAEKGEHEGGSCSCFE